MNREILFKGKRKDTKEWVFGHLTQCVDIVLIFPRGEEFYYDELEKFAFDMTAYEVIPETVEQYTGLKDKNGKKIFEGDILNIDCYAYDEPETSYFGCVECDEFGYGLLTPDGRGGYTWYYMCDVRGSYITEYEICGNIHDTPELLEEPS